MKKPEQKTERVSSCARQELEGDHIENLSGITAESDCQTVNLVRILSSPGLINDPWIIPLQELEDRTKR